MSIDLTEFQSKARMAIQTFWRTREAARQKQSVSGKFGQGERAGVTAGKNIVGLIPF